MHKSPGNVDSEAHFFTVFRMRAAGSPQRMGMLEPHSYNMAKKTAHIHISFFKGIKEYCTSWWMPF